MSMSLSTNSFLSLRFVSNHHTFGLNSPMTYTDLLRLISGWYIYIQKENHNAFERHIIVSQ